jgi:hypothetical protein
VTTGSTSGSSWFPTPPPKPLKAPSAAKLIFGGLTSAAVVGGIAASFIFGPSRSKPQPAATTPAAVARTSAAADRREAFAQCLKNMGGDSGFRPRGRFGGGGPSRSAREAFAVCRSLTAGGGGPAPPPRTPTVTAPVA